LPDSHLNEMPSRGTYKGLQRQLAKNDGEKTATTKDGIAYRPFKAADGTERGTTVFEQSVMLVPAHATEIEDDWQELSGGEAVEARQQVPHDALEKWNGVIFGDPRAMQDKHAVRECPPRQSWQSRFADVNSSGRNRRES
jgi:hypothetical protein